MRKYLGYNFKIEYKAGHSNIAADALSRLPEEKLFELVASRPIPEFLVKLKEENMQLEDLQKLHKHLCEGKLNTDYTVKDGVLFYKKRYCLSPKSFLIPGILQEYHASLLAGHSGVKL